MVAQVQASTLIPIAIKMKTVLAPRSVNVMGKASPCRLFSMGMLL